LSLRFQRANFLVRDIDQALTFYRDVLGFEVAFVHASEEDSYSYPVFEIDRSQPIRFATLNAPGQERVMALTEVPNLEHQGTPRRAAIVLDISDIDGVVSRAQAGGFTVYDEEQLITHDGRSGREVGLVDGDGNLIVIYHIRTA